MESFTKDDLKDVLREIKSEAGPHNTYYQNASPRPVQGEVTSVINSAIFWVGTLATVLAFVGVLMYMIYAKDSTSKEDRIDSNTNAIEAIQETQNKTNNLIGSMQNTQERIAKQIEKNADKLETIDDHYDSLQGSRFTDKDGEDLGDDLDNGIRAVREEVLREITEIKADLRGMDKDIDDFRMLTSKVEDNKSELMRRNDFMDDIKARITTLESKVKP